MKFLVKVYRFLLSIFRWLYYYPRFAKLGFRSAIFSPLRIDGGKRIEIGRNVQVGYKSWLASNPLTGLDSKLIIEDGCAIGNFNHIYATQSIIIHRYVLTADKVYISDNLHGYSNVGIPILKQPVVQHGEVEIGEGSWLGENVCVLGVKIGKHCVIGANSVVTSDIPDYSIAVGAPAKIIKQYDFTTNSWEKVESTTVVKDDLGGVISSLNYVPRKVSFREFHYSCSIKSPILITPGCISLGENVYIGHHARIQGIESYNSRKYHPHIIIHNGVSIEQNLHLTCANRIEIGVNTAIAANVTITDIHHPYDDITQPIEKQEIVVKEVQIGEDCKIYNNVVILPGVHIGKHVTVGANSVVTDDVEDYTVIAGSPARIIKKFDFEKNMWVKYE